MCFNWRAGSRGKRDVRARLFSKAGFGTNCNPRTEQSNKFNPSIGPTLNLAEAVSAVKMQEKPMHAFLNYVKSGTQVSFYKYL